MLNRLNLWRFINAKSLSGALYGKNFKKFLFYLINIKSLGYVYSILRNSWIIVNYLYHLATDQIPIEFRKMVQNVAYEYLSNCIQIK